MLYLYKACIKHVLTNGTTGGKKLSLYFIPPGKRLLATAFNNVHGFRSEARPIRRYIDPG